MIRIGGSEDNGLDVDDRVTMTVDDWAAVNVIGDGCRLKDHVDAWADSEERLIGHVAKEQAEEPAAHLVDAV